jgi:hypothetical protein
MKYLKKIFESNNFNSMTDDELEEKLTWLRIEYSEIFREISLIVNIQKTRKESSEDELTKDWPDSIWDLDKSQIDWVLEHNNITTSKHYEISHKYLRGLEGVIDSGFNPDTNQYLFKICTDYWMDDSESEYQENEEGIRSIKFLIDNLKRITVNGDSVIKFNVLFMESDDYDYALLYYNDSKVVLSSGYMLNEYKSLEEAIKILVDHDING